MATIAARCACGRVTEVADSLIGEEIRCGNCGAVFVVCRHCHKVANVPETLEPPKSPFDAITASDKEIFDAAVAAQRLANALRLVGSIIANVVYIVAFFVLLGGIFLGMAAAIGNVDRIPSVRDAMAAQEAGQTLTPEDARVAVIASLIIGGIYSGCLCVLGYLISLVMKGSAAGLEILCAIAVRLPTLRSRAESGESTPPPAAPAEGPGVS